MKAVKLYQKVEKEFNNVKWRLDELYRTMYSYMFLVDNIDQGKHGKEVAEIWRTTLKKRVTRIFEDMLIKNDAMKDLLESMRTRLFDIIAKKGTQDEAEETSASGEDVSDSV